MTLAEKWNGILDEIISSCKTLDGLQDQLFPNSFNATTGTLSTGTLRAVQITDLPTLNYIDSFDIKVNVAAGNVRIKIYSDAANKPDIFLW